MLARALRISLSLELLLYLVLAMSLCDVSFVAAVPLAALAMLALRALLVAVTYAFAWVHRSSAARLSLRQATLMVLGEYASSLLSFMVIMPFEHWWMGDDRLPASGQDRGPGGDFCARRAPVLLIHGYGCSRGAWWWLRQHLEAAGWTVATISLEPVSGAEGETRFRPVVHDACVGCGTCEMICPAEPAAIVVDTELALARGA